MNAVKHCAERHNEVIVVLAGLKPDLSRRISPPARGIPSKRTRAPVIVGSFREFFKASISGPRTRLMKYMLATAG